MKTIVVSIALFLSAVFVASFAIIAVSLVRPSAADLEAGEGVRVAGVGNSGNTIYGSPSISRLLRRARALDLAPTVTDDMLRKCMVAVLDRAAQGDVEAAGIAFEIAAWQRSKSVQAPASGR